MGNGMKVDRFISMGPRRGTEQTCLAIVDFLTEVTQERSRRHAEEVRLGLGKALPLLRFLLTVRRFGEPAIVLEMPELLVALHISHDPDTADDLTLPSMALLGSLHPGDLIGITLHTTAEVTGALSQIPGEASAGVVRFRLAPGPSTRDPEPAVPPGGSAEDTRVDDIAPVPDVDPRGPEDVPPDDPEQHTEELGRPSSDWQRG